jgi:hypothetical protein
MSGVATDDSTASDICADTARGSQTDEKWDKRKGRISRIYHTESEAGPMAERAATANTANSCARARVRHVCTQQ